jgi:hypothetical protein
MTSRTFSLTKPAQACHQGHGDQGRGDGDEQHQRGRRARMLAQQEDGHLHMGKAQEGHRQAR